MADMALLFGTLRHTEDEDRVCLHKKAGVPIRFQITFIASRLQNGGGWLNIVSTISKLQLIYKQNKRKGSSILTHMMASFQILFLRIFVLSFWQ